MSSQMAEAIRQLQDNGYTKEAVLNTIENMLKAAYKRTFGTNVNAVVQFNEDETDVAIYSRKVIVDGVYDPVTEIELEEAKLLSEECTSNISPFFTPSERTASVIALLVTIFSRPPNKSARILWFGYQFLFCPKPLRQKSLTLGFRQQ